jgi:hypothetical protein
VSAPPERRRANAVTGAVTLVTSRVFCTLQSVEIPLAVHSDGRQGGWALSKTLSRTRGAVPMSDMTAEDLQEHISLIRDASTEELDELLHDLLVRTYPSKRTQDS